MKKILLILFLFLSCYIIYAKTYDDKKFYLAVGDGITAGYNDIIINYLDNLDILKEYNNSFINTFSYGPSYFYYESEHLTDKEKQKIKELL